MQSRLRCTRLFVGLLIIVSGLFSTGAFGQTLKQVAKFDLPGPGGKRFDYLTIDDDDHYLLSAHLGADQTYVIDLRTNKVVASGAMLAQGRRATRLRYAPTGLSLHSGVIYEFPSIAHQVDCATTVPESI